VTELRVITETGYLVIPAEDHWSVLSMKTKTPVIEALFQIPNPADAGTPESTNLVIQFFPLASAEGRAAMAESPPRAGPEPARVETVGGWTVTRQRGTLRATTYSVVDARRELTGFAVKVRFAWPHLAKNPGDYDRQMESILRSVLETIREHVGPYVPREGEVIRRPE
jgi:hypothetical protein